MIACYYYDTPLGKIGIAENGKAITHVFLTSKAPMPVKEKETFLIMEAHAQLTAYFNGQLKDFSLPLEASGTPFQKQVWNALCQIPYGKTQSYSETAIAVGNPKASRAVGMANHNNPIMILIPCHRVIGKNGRMTGYAGGIEVKEKLLALESGKNVF